jgi:hypothetical protein
MSSSGLCQTQVNGDIEKAKQYQHITDQINTT